MATEVYSGPLGEIRKAHTTAGGDASTTTAAVVQFYVGTQFVAVEARNYTTAVVVLVGLCPYLTILKTGDALATATDNSEVCQDNNTATTATLNSWDTAANNHYLYLGAHQQFRGVVVDVVNTNSNASVLSTDYWNGSTWANASSTDGTINTGASFGQDGSITWTVPTDWAKVDLATAVTTTGAAVPQRTAPLYWVRFKVSAAFDATVSAASIVALAKSANGYELVTGRVREMLVSRGVGGFAGIEHRTDAGTANVLVNVGAVGRGGLV